MNCQPFVQALVEAIAFLELSDDDVVDPDAAVTELERIADILKSLGTPERKMLLDYVAQLAAGQEFRPGCSTRTEFFSNFATNMGLM